MEIYVAPYVQVRHAIHLLYAISPRSRDGAGTTAIPAGEDQLIAPDQPAAAGEPHPDIDPGPDR